MNGWALNGPSETDQTDWQTGCSVKKEPQSRLVLSFLVIGLSLTFLDVAPDRRNEEQPSDHVTDTDTNEAQTDLDSGKVPLLVHKAVGLDEHEDQSVGETREERENQDDGLGQEHLEGAHPGDQDFLGGESLAEGNELVRTPEVLALGAALLSNAVHHDGGSSLRDSEEVDELDGTSKDELDPDRPSVTC